MRYLFKSNTTFFLQENISMKSLPPSSPVLLTIEDDSLLRSTLTTYLVRYGYTMFEAENGQQGLELLNHGRSHGNPAGGDEPLHQRFSRP